MCLTTVLTWGREVTGDLAAAERREWLCVNNIGGFASGTIAGTQTRRYHGLLFAALKPPLGRTLTAATVHETVDYAGAAWPLFTARWTSGTLDPQGYRHIEEFRVDGTTPVWTYACVDALIEKRVWMEPGANTTYVRWRLLRGREPLTLNIKALVDYRDYHATTRAGDWRMEVAPVRDGLRVSAFDGARPLLLVAPGAEAEPAHVWFRDFDLPRERERGLEHVEDHLHVGTFHATLAEGASLTLTLSVETVWSPDGDAALLRRTAHEANVLARWRRRRPAASAEPEWVARLVLAADQFLVRRPLAEDPHGSTIIAGYHWFGDWGRDTMIALPGLTLMTGRAETARTILTTFARFVDRGLLPNRFPDGGEPPEYNTADATLWYIEAVRAYQASTGDDGLIKQLYPTLESIVAWHREGTRYGIRQDPSDGLLCAGEPGVQLTWMDAKIGDWVITPRIGKPVEIKWARAIDDYESAQRVAERAGDHFRIYIIKFWEGRAYTRAGDASRGRILVEEGFALAEQIGTNFVLAHGKVSHAECLLALNEPDPSGIPRLPGGAPWNIPQRERKDQSHCRDNGGRARLHVSGKCDATESSQCAPSMSSTGTDAPRSRA